PSKTNCVGIKAAAASAASRDPTMGTTVERAPPAAIVDAASASALLAVRGCMDFQTPAKSTPITAAAASDASAHQRGRRGEAKGSRSSSLGDVSTARTRAADATIRAIVPVPAGGSARRLSSARSTISPGSPRRSATIPPRQPRSEMIARTLDAHLQRRLSHAGDALDLLIREALHIMQQKNLPIVLRYLGERPTDVVAPLLVEGRVRSIR